MHPWRDRLSRWFTPLARRTPLSPNAISVIALLLSLGAAGLLAAGGRRPVYFLLAIVLIAVGGLADALDGIVARVQQKESAFGDFLDHCFDRIADTAVAVGWLLGNGVRPLLVIAAVSVILMNGYVGTQIEATFRERNYETIGRGEFVLALIVYPIFSYIIFSNGWDTLRFAGLAIAEWMSLLMIASGVLGIAERFALARRLGRS
ncbi:MAG: CDP-alcohol phosphatidyltransferase family protein [Acidobacteriota bacterium]